MVVYEALGAHYMLLTLVVDLVVRHPFPRFTRPGSYFADPFLEGSRVDKLMLVGANNDKSIRFKGRKLCGGQLVGTHNGGFDERMAFALRWERKVARRPKTGLSFSFLLECLAWRSLYIGHQHRAFHASPAVVTVNSAALSSWISPAMLGVGRNLEGPRLHFSEFTPDGQ